MSNDDNAGVLFGLAVLAAILAVPAYHGVFYTTGRQWYEKCYEYDVERQLQSKGGWDEPKTSDPYKAAFWATCEEQSKRGIYRAGLVFTWQNPQLTKFCPSMSDVPIAGTYPLTLKLIKDNGGLSLEYNFIPATGMIKDLWRYAWPKCAAERTKAGYPAIVEHNKAGSFGWARPCEKCDASLVIAD